MQRTTPELAFTSQYVTHGISGTSKNLDGLNLSFWLKAKW